MYFKHASSPPPRALHTCSRTWFFLVCWFDWHYLLAILLCWCWDELSLNLRGKFSDAHSRETPDWNPPSDTADVQCMYMCMINEAIIRNVFRLGIAVHVSQSENNAFFSSLMVLEIQWYRSLEKELRIFILTLFKFHRVVDPSWKNGRGKWAFHKNSNCSAKMGSSVRYGPPYEFKMWNCPDYRSFYAKSFACPNIIFYGCVS